MTLPIGPTVNVRQAQLQANRTRMFLMILELVEVICILDLVEVKVGEKAKIGLSRR